MQRLDEVEHVIKRRLVRLDARQSGDWIRDMGRKLAEVATIADLIIS